MRSPQDLRSLFEDHLQGITQNPLWKGQLYDPMRYILDLGGKRIRPLLLLLTYQSLSREDASKALDAAAAVELFHNFSLLHDDIMDNAPVRRGEPTVHEKWDQSTAILSGDAMFALTFQMLVKNFPEKAATLISEYTRISIGVCEGQMEDMVMAESEEVDLARYLEMIRKKTAMLIGGSMSLAAICAGAPPELVGHIRHYGELNGVAFQLQDDYLDVYADQAKFGKQVGGDILENKKTYLLLRAYEKADDIQTQALDAFSGEIDPDIKVRGVMKLYEELEVRQDTRDRIEAHFAEARKLSAELSEFAGFEHIRDFMETLVQRDY